MKLAVLILTHNRSGLLKECLESIERQVEHPFELSLYLMVNGPDPETESFLKSKDLDYQISREPLPVGEARNLLIERIDESYICFLDDDITLPEDYFNKAAGFINKFPKVDIFGGPDQNPTISSDFQKCLSLVMESYLATGPTNKRHLRDELASEEGDEINLILCNFWAKRKVFELQKFPRTFKRNEENLLLAILKDKGVVMRRIPNLYVFHNRKVSIAKLARVLFLAGIYRMVSLITYPRSLRPIFFVHQLLLALLLYALWMNLGLAWILIAGYLILIGIPSARIAWTTGRARNLPLAMVLFMVFNFVYPVGQFAGYFVAIGHLAKGRGLE